MFGWFVWGAMDLARTVKYAVHARWSLVISLIRLFPLTGLIAAESGIDCRVFGVVAIVATLVSIASWLAVAISGI